MVKALCINSKNLILPKDSSLLTEGKFYSVVQNIENTILVVVDDTGQMGSYSIDRFKLAEQLRDEKLEQLGIYSIT
jgi:hypothetical protein